MARAFGLEVTVARPRFSSSSLPQTGGVGCFLQKLPPMLLMDLMLGVGYQVLFVRFCALLLHFICVRRGQRSVEAGTIFRMSSSVEWTLWRLL